MFPISRTPKRWLDKCLKSPVSDYRSTSNMINVPKHCWNLHHSTFIIFLDHIHLSLGIKLSWKKSLLLTWETLGLPVTTMPADEKYPVVNRDNLTILIQMQLSQKQEKLFNFFLFLKIYIKFWIFWKKDDCQSFRISALTHSENVAR